MSARDDLHSFHAAIEPLMNKHQICAVLMMTPSGLTAFASQPPRDTLELLRAILAGGEKQIHELAETYAGQDTPCDPPTA